MPDYDADRFTVIYDGCRQRVWAYVVSRAGRQVADELVNMLTLSGCSVSFRRVSV